MGLHHYAPDREHVRRALGTFAAGVTIVTTFDDDSNAVGMTATAFTSVSFTPPSALICLSLSARTHNVIRTRGRFGVNLLATDGQELCDYCSAPGGDKVLPVMWLDTKSAWNAPCLNSAMVFFDCQVTEAIETGTHVIIIGSIKAIGLSAHRDSTGPLLHFRGNYRRLSPIEPGTSPDPLPIVFEDSLIMEAHQQ
ncbi:flavin reductase family protein [Saxibacter everestensis]|uniref:Flavin reductase family protein n=1 Tax=Saxibacter everestensis TaxID=2909229 RepID=A0ABY8QRS2_9MICO|nr:flavin reductase family protein [Brevibacteriaceae bacterium ZFBP1038]